MYSSGLLAQLLKRLVNLRLNPLSEMLVNSLAMLLSEMFKHLLVWIGKIDFKRH
jgi:hypothetical protein